MVATYGGTIASDFLSGAIMGTTCAIISGQGPEYGIGLAVPIGLLLTQLDILGRMTNAFFQHRTDRAAEQGNYREVERANMLGMIPWILSRAIPVFFGSVFGELVVTTINEFIPTWIMTGLKSAGAILPAMGIAILMRYLAIKKYYPYFILGFVLIAFSGGSYTALAAALVGFALAAMHVTRSKEKQPALSGGNSNDDEKVETNG